MCVAVTLAPGTDLTLQEVERMNRSNADGVGVAWARGGIVQWYKTTKVDPKYITGMISAWKAYPRLVHFRFSTAGGTRPELCHPFEVGPKANCHPVGTAAKVMIHNGHWSRWDEVKSLLDKEDLLPDKGPWSDSRLAAYLAHTDPDWFSALGGRVAVMDGDGTIARLGDWQELRNGIMVSNKSWDNNNTYTRGGYTGYRAWKGWQWNEDEWDAFYKDQEEQEKRDAEAIRAEIAKAQKEEARAKAKQEKRDKRNGQRARRDTAPIQLLAGGSSGNASEDGFPHNPTCGAPDCAATPGPRGCKDDKACAWDDPNPRPASVSSARSAGTQQASQVAGARYIDPKPWHNERNGKWYKTVNTRGIVEVVEVAAPSQEGAART